jgi:hypothetical protein
MYKKLLEQMKAEINASASIPDKKGGMINRPPAPKQEKSDPLALSREWIATIKASGEYFRNEIKPKKIEEIKKNEEEQVKVEAEAPIEDPVKVDPITNRPSIFDGMNVGGGGGGEFDMSNFKLPTYDGEEGDVTSLIRQAAQKYGLPEDIVLRVARQESGFKQNAKSGAGAIGVMQLMPGTAQGLGVDPYDIHQNIDGGVRYLKEQYDNFGSWDKALAGYNAGPGAVQKYGGVPPYKETQNYVRSILGG